jgi:hypothetical protein
MDDKKENVQVIVVKDSVVDEVVPCDDGQHAEQVFIKKCEEKISNFDEYTDMDVQAIIDNGYEKFGGTNSICIVWL